MGQLSLRKRGLLLAEIGSWQFLLGALPPPWGRGARGENPLAFCEGLSGAPVSEESSFRKAHDARPRDDEMVEHLNVDEG